MNEIDIVVDVRQSPDTAELIVSKQKVAFSGEAHLVGSPVESRVGLMTLKAQVSAFSFANREMGVVLAVHVKNGGIVPLNIDSVAFVHEFKEPQDVPTASAAGMKQLGGSVSLCPRDPTRVGAFQPGESRDYYLLPQLFDSVALTAVSLHPHQFWIAAYSGEDEVGRVGGEYIWPFLERAGIVINRRALPLFDTLPESDRLAVVQAAAVLRKIERDRWVETGAQPLDGVPLAFVVRAGEDLGIIVTQTQDKGVEIVDIVRPSSIEQFGQAGEDPKP
jgi:hypothetical protein